MAKRLLERLNAGSTQEPNSHWTSVEIELWTAGLDSSFTTFVYFLLDNRKEEAEMKLWKILVLVPYALIFVFAHIFSSLVEEAGLVGAVVGVALLMYAGLWMFVYTCVLGAALAIRWAILRRRLAS